MRFILYLVVFMVPAALAGMVSARLAASWRDEWKLMAWVPVLPLAAWAVFIAWGVARDDTSHNLWPFELIMVGMLSLLLFGAVALAHRFFGQRQEPGAWRHRKR